MSNPNPFGVTHVMCRKVCGHCHGTRNEGESLLTPCIVCKGSGDEPVGVPLEDFMKTIFWDSEEANNKRLGTETVENIVAARIRRGGKPTV